MPEGERTAVLLEIGVTLIPRMEKRKYGAWERFCHRKKSLRARWVGLVKRKRRIYMRSQKKKLEDVLPRVRGTY